MQHVTNNFAVNEDELPNKHCLCQIMDLLSFSCFLSSSPASWNRCEVWRGYCCFLPSPILSEPVDRSNRDTWKEVDFVRRTLIDSELTMTHWSTAIHFDSLAQSTQGVIDLVKMCQQVRVSSGQTWKRRSKALLPQWMKDHLPSSPPSSFQSTYLFHLC